MSTTTFLLLVIAAGIATYAIRYSFLFFAGRIEMPYYFQQGLRFVPVTVLTALVIPNLLYQDGQLTVGIGNERLIAGLVAIAVAFYTKNVLVTMGVGMAVLWILQAVTG